MNEVFPKIYHDIQDRNCQAWQKLCEVIDKIAREEKDEFSPLEELGPDMFSQIYTLPKSIAKLKKVKKLWLYRSNIVRLPPEIGEMESLEYFDPYTSYNLRWFPYELTHCKNLIDSRISTRAFFGNYKNRMPFPDLTYNPLRYYEDQLKCSICKKIISYEDTNQMWITLRVATDTIPLLVNLCSEACQLNLPKPPDGYVQYPHKGGQSIIQPGKKRSSEQWQKNYSDNIRNLFDAFYGKVNKIEDQNIPKAPLSKPEISSKLSFLKFIKKIWEK